MDEFLRVRQQFKPTPERPLLGVSMLIVEDSRFASESIRLLCQKSGARFRRADCLGSARKHLRVYSPNIIIVDLGLPDGSGLDLIRDLRKHPNLNSQIIATSGDDTMARSAREAGADLYMAKPILSLAHFQSEVLRLLPEAYLGLWQTVDETVRPDPLALLDDMRYAAETLTLSDDPRTLDYLGRFVSGIARTAKDDVLESAAQDLIKQRSLGRPLNSTTARLGALLQERLKESAFV